MTGTDSASLPRIIGWAIVVGAVSALVTVAVLHLLDVGLESGVMGGIVGGVAGGVSSAFTSTRMRNARKQRDEEGAG